MARRIEHFDDEHRKNREKQTRFRAKRVALDAWKAEFAKLSRLPTPPPEHMQGTWGVFEQGSPPRAAAAFVVGREPAGWQRSTVLGRLYSKGDAALLAEARDRQLKDGL